MKAIIFGDSGQDGHYLRQMLESKDIEVFGFSRSGINLKGDVSNFESVTGIVKSIQPDFIIHFAANSSTRHETLFDNHGAIGTGTINILEASRLFCPKAKIFLSGSAMQFKNDNTPIDESTEFIASSPYSVSRIHSVYAARYYRQTFNTRAYVGYFFNHDSPLRSEKHVNQKIAAAVRRISAGSREILELGNIEVKKEFSFAGDIVDAVWTLLNQNAVFEAVIGSGIAYSIKDWVEYCFEKRGLNWKEHVRITSGFVPEYNLLVSNPALIKSLGWKPKTSFSQLADMMMESL